MSAQESIGSKGTGLRETETTVLAFGEGNGEIEADVQEDNENIVIPQNTNKILFILTIIQLLINKK
jgi:hypothetical protein